MESFWYPTKEEAQAFKEGVEYVNDSSIINVGITEGTEPGRGAGWIVYVEDEDDLED